MGHSDTKWGRLVLLEGGEGVGKSTQTGMLESFLRRRGERVTVVAEPGGTPVGSMVRTMLFTDLATQELMTPERQLLAFTLQRDALLDCVVLPALRRGEWVVSDRSIISSFVYQRLGGCTVERIREVSRVVLEKLRTIREHTTVIILDLPPDVSRVRALAGTARTVNAFDEVPVDEYARRRELYVEGSCLAGWETPHLVIAQGTRAQVRNRILKRLGLGR